MRAILCYKNFSKECDISHIGMGVTAHYTAKTLTHEGHPTQAMPFFGGDDLTAFLEREELGDNRVTHVVILAQWIPTVWLAKLARRFPYTKFALNCHSNVGFLQAEPGAITLLREAIDLQTGTSNFRAGSNNLRLVSILQDIYGQPVQFLPNLYYLHGWEPVFRPRWQGGTIKIGCFGSLRTYKNFSAAVTAAMEVGFMLRAPVEIWMNGGRADGDKSNIVYKTAVAWTRNVPNVELKQLHWATWPEFKRFIGTMNLLLQPSFTETFNNVTADGVAEGVPSVVSDAIDWVPESWIASADDTKDIAQRARQLLFDFHAPRDGYYALKRYVSDGIPHWKKFFGC